VDERDGAGLPILGVAIDPVRNRATGSPPDVEIGREGALVRSFVIEAREDREIARNVRRLHG
jgi:acetate kinase